MRRSTRFIVAGLASWAIGISRVAVAADTPAAGDTKAGAGTKATAGDDDTTFELGLSAGWVPTSTSLSGSGVAAGAASGPATPFASGRESLGTSGFAASGRATILTPYYGAGIFRAFFLAGGTVFFGRKGEATLDTLHGGGSVSRTFAIDLAVGGNFPFCQSPACADLRLFLGMSVVRQSASAFVDESTRGGKREVNDQNGFRWGTLWGASFTKPLCSQCTRDALRLEIAVMLRAVPSTALGFTSGTGTTYTMGVDNSFEAHLQAGLLLPL